MSWSIPTKVEADIQAGLAEYKTFQTGMGGQTVLVVPNNSYIVIFGMDYQPSGNGLTEVRQFAQAPGNFFPDDISRFCTQQVSFWTGNQFFPFIFHAPFKLGGVVPNAPVAGQMLLCNYVDNAPIARSLYIPSNTDVTITVGIIKVAQQNTTGAIPITNATPAGLTYGGSGQVINVQTDFNQTFGQTTQFLQPNPKLFDSMGFGIAPAGQSDQAYAQPDFPEGLDDASRILTTIGGGAQNIAALNYFLTLHYAIYSSAPNDRFI